jgi:hypothetical protein
MGGRDMKDIGLQVGRNVTWSLKRREIKRG